MKPYLVLAPANSKEGEPGKGTVLILPGNNNGYTHLIHEIFVSYSSEPTNGKLTISNKDGKVVFVQSVTEAGSTSFSFDMPVITGIAESVCVELFSGGEGVVGTITLIHELSKV